MVIELNSEEVRSYSIPIFGIVRSQSRAFVRTAKRSIAGVLGISGVVGVARVAGVAGVPTNSESAVACAATGNIKTTIMAHRITPMALFGVILFTV